MFAEQLLDLIENRCRALGLTEVELSQAVAGHRTLVTDIRRGRSPNGERLQKICDALGLEFYIGPPRDIAGLPDPRGYDPEVDDADYVMVPKLPVLLAAGHGAAAPEHEEPVELLAFRQEWMQRYGLKPGKVSAVEVTGDSMVPTLSAGDTVLVDHLRNEPRQGRIFAVRREDELLVKRTQKEPDSGWMLTSDNESYEPISIGADFAVIGEVVWRGTWLGEEMASKKQVADLLKLFEVLGQHRVDTGAAASLEEAIESIEAEMAEAGVFDDDEE